MKQTLMSTAAAVPPTADLEEPADNGAYPALTNVAVDEPTPTEPTVETMTVHPEVAFKKLGVGRSSGYDALHRGEIPSMRIGRFFRVPIALLDKMLAGEWRPGT